MKDVFKMKIDIPEKVKFILSALENEGFEAYAVGGCVRDSIMGKTPNDWDMTSSALPRETINIFEGLGLKVIKTGIKHGTVTVLFEGEPFEITTFRIDGEYSDCRRPDEITFTRSLEEDLKRRDFTVNALAADKNGFVKDFFGGKEDIDNKILKAIGDPDKRLSEDALRIMRALRFSSVLGFTIDAELKKSLKRNRELLKNIAAERINAEFSKLILGKDFEKILLEYSDIIAVFIPETVPTVGFNQRNIHHIYDVFTHSVKAMAAIPPELTLRLAMLFHDIEKPACFFLGEDGQGHFYSHAEKSAETAEKILKRLRYDNTTVKEVKELIRLHDIEIVPEKKPVLRRMGKTGKENFYKLIKIKYADNAAQSPIVAGRRETFKRIEEIAAEAEREENCFSLKSLKVNGRDLIDAGVPEGKEVGKALEFLLEAVIDGRCENEREKLLRYIKLHPSFYKKQ